MNDKPRSRSKPKKRVPRLNARDAPRVDERRGRIQKWISWLIGVLRDAATAWNNRPR